MKDLERLANYYLSGRGKLKRPRYLCYNATLRCDGRCAHCGIWEQKNKGAEITTEELSAILSSPLFSEVETAWITGGEPTLREDIGSIGGVMAGKLSAMKTLGIATNALDSVRTLKSVSALRGWLRDGQGLFVHISVDGAGELHDRIRQKPGAFEAIKETIAGVQTIAGKSGPHVEVGLNCVVQPENVEGLPELHRFARFAGIKIMYNLVMVTDQIYRNEQKGDALSLSEDERKKTIDFLRSIMDEEPRPFRYQYKNIIDILSGKKRGRRCLTLYTTVNINADGTWIPCPATSDLEPISFVENDPEEIWHDKKARALRKRAEKEYCPACALSCSLGDSMPISEWLAGGWD